jgi:hypothetical protein
MKRKRRVSFLSPSEIEDRWQQRAVAAAIAAARGVAGVGGAVPPGTPIGRLSDTEWGWITAGILFSWIHVRSEQAVAENIDTEQAIRLTGLDHNPWDAGAVAAILPDLASACPDIDWSEPLAKWPRETMVEFLTAALTLIRRAVIARDLGEKGIAQKSSASTIVRHANAAVGEPPMTPDEFDDVKL